MTNQVTVVGLGPMGATMAERFLDAGYDVTVWNRTASKAAPLVARGARPAERPTGDLMVISQLNYRAMYDSLAGVDLKGKVLVNLSSDSPKVLREAASWVAGQGGVLVTAGIMVPPPGIGQPGSYAFYSGPGEVIERHSQTLRALGDVVDVGTDPGLAMLYYQAQLYVFWSTLTSFMHATALLGSAGVKPGQGLPYFKETVGLLASDGPMGFLQQLSDEIEAGEYPGELNSMHMMAVGAEHALDAFRDAGLETTMPEALKALFERTDREGHGADGLGAVIEMIKKP
ncbi:NAD(P)-dependent oxidoreductase [Nonomuraea typhae]|uniref:NAD(P)-dependent oxidoreductase n=1 Tax=Nonomuraea typhae TaxID=2603600 RepID=A0ABW7YX08_9ACTN